MSAELRERRTSMSSGSRSVTGGPTPSPALNPGNTFEPCAATASLVLFAQGSTIISLHHDTLAVDRRFDSHEDDIHFIAIDNVSERGAGRLVVSYDTGQTAIIWDLFTGQEIARFASFEFICVATWMRNGNIAFGSARGDIILFEPSTSEHVSARTIFDPITALAPASDCQSYAIGYQNGSILIATLQPSFTILHTLSTSRAPSTIISLAWHASSTKQRSEMLASQTVDGDVFVWSVMKQSGQEPPRVIRALKRPGSSTETPKWLAWSKNGRIIQYADGEAWAWDVKTKHVTYETIPTVEGVRGITNYGPTAALFTLGPNDTVQQYDVTDPALLANVQHNPGSRSSTPAASLKNSALPPQFTSQIQRQHSPGPRDLTTSPSPRTIPKGGSMQGELDRGFLRSPETPYVPSLHSNGHYRPSGRSRTVYSGATGTTFSTNSPVSSIPETLSSSHSMKYASSVSTRSGRSRHGSSRLRNEVVPSDVDEPIKELFPYIQVRLNDMPFQPPARMTEQNANPDELRRQMLNVVFGWNGDITDLISDELSRHPPGGQHALILGRWLGNVDTETLLSMATSADSRYNGWMFLALNQLNGQPEAKKLGHALVQQLLTKGDIHAAVAVLIGIGDGNDGAEIYVVRNMYMEAILLTCLTAPLDWTRQSYLVRRWGEFVVQNSQQHLAIRCFSCADSGSSEAWESPSAQMTNTLTTQLANDRSASSPLPSNTSPTSSRSVPKNQALKLITSFPNDAPARAFKFPGLESADGTPTNVMGVTPIESAMGDSVTSPGAFGQHRQKLSRQALSARSTTPGGYIKQRLPSIGETPTDVAPPKPPVPKSLPTPVDSGSEKGNEAKAAANSSVQQPGAEDLVFLTSARYTPSNESTEAEATPVAREEPNPISIASINAQSNSLSQTRNGSRDRKPEGLHIQWPPVYQYTGSEEAGLNESAGAKLGSPFHGRAESSASRPSPAMSVDSSKSAPMAGRGGNGTGQSMGSIDGISYYSQVQSSGGSDYGGRSHRKGRSKTRSKETRDGSKQRYIQPAKRSPSSPVPMSPEDLALYSAAANESSSDPSATQEAGRPRSRSVNTAAGSSQRQPSKTRYSKSRPSSRTGEHTRQERGRRRENSFGLRSPSSPVPMSPSRDEDAAGDNLRLVDADRRLRQKDRSVIRHAERGASARRERSADRRQVRDRSHSRQAREQATTSPFVDRSIESYDPERNYRYADSSDRASPFLTFAPPDDRRPFSPPQNEADRVRKESAAAELEARRLSLVRRPSAPTIPLPPSLNMPPSRSRGQSIESPLMSNGSFSQRAMGRQNGSPADFTHLEQNYPNRAPSVPVGLPATPRAMKHPNHSGGHGSSDVPPLPDIPNAHNFSDYSGSAWSIARSASAPVPDDIRAPGGKGIPAHRHFQPQLPSSRSGSVSTHRPRESTHEAGLQPSQYQRPSVPGVEIVKNGSEAPLPPVLPELQHLNPGPPPPPPPPPQHPGADHFGYNRISFPPGDRSSVGSGVGTINIAIDEPAVLTPREQTFHQQGGGTYDVPPPTTNGGRVSAPPETHRRGRSANENFTSKIRNLTGRMRSTSRGRNIGHPQPIDRDALSPYESVNANMFGMKENNPQKEAFSHS